MTMGSCAGVFELEVRESLRGCAPYSVSNLGSAQIYIYFGRPQIPTNTFCSHVNAVCHESRKSGLNRGTKLVSALNVQHSSILRRHLTDDPRHARVQYQWFQPSHDEVSDVTDLVTTMATNYCPPATGKARPDS